MEISSLHAQSRPTDPTRRRRIADRLGDLLTSVAPPPAEIDPILVAEREIDEGFADHPLKALPHAQAVWALLSAIEEHHFKFAVVQQLSPPEAAIYVDGVINSATYPMRVLHAQARRDEGFPDRRLNNSTYAMADDWLGAGEDYSQFCSMFPLYRAGQISLRIAAEGRLEASDWSADDLRFEAYDRFVAKRSPKHERVLDPNKVAATIANRVTASGGLFVVNFDTKLLRALDVHIAPHFRSRHVLPDRWKFGSFSIEEYRAVFICLQAMAEAWFAARQMVANAGTPGMGYEGAVWLTRKSTLVMTISRHCSLRKDIVGAVIDYLTFGAVGIRHPDVAIQPLLDIGSGILAIAPLLVTQINAERNLCVLLNQIPAEQKIYSRLVDEKETQLRREAEQTLAGRFDLRYGQVEGTDVDLAIIDHVRKTCLCVELKWFIEPAEIREVLVRCKELVKGVEQCRKLNALFAGKDRRLFGLLAIDHSYDFLAAVGSVNFIGRPANQDPAVPIIKVWHLLDQIQEVGLPATVAWLRGRAYLPEPGRDFRVMTMNVKCGRWSSQWYGLGLVEDSTPENGAPELL